MSAVDDWRRLVRGELPAAMLSHPDCKIAIINVYDLASNRHLGRHPAGNERGAVDDQDAVRWMRDLKIGEVAGADFVEIAPLVVVVALESCNKIIEQSASRTAMSPSIMAVSSKTLISLIAKSASGISARFLVKIPAICRNARDGSPKLTSLTSSANLDIMSRARRMAA